MGCGYRLRPKRGPGKACLLLHETQQAPLWGLPCRVPRHLQPLPFLGFKLRGMWSGTRMDPGQPMGLTRTICSHAPHPKQVQVYGSLLGLLRRTSISKMQAFEGFEDQLELPHHSNPRLSCLGVYGPKFPTGEEARSASWKL